MKPTLDSVKDKLRMVITPFACKSVCLSYEEIVILVDECERLASKINELEQTIEDVAVGTAMKCSVCGQYKPCICDKS